MTDTKELPEIGTLMPDGSIYAGLLPDGRRLYAAAQDLSKLMKWEDSKAACAALEAHWYSDWRQPTRMENLMLEQVKNQGAFAGTFVTKMDGSTFAHWYWSCTEHPVLSALAYGVYFTDGDVDLSAKALYELSVRPVRTEP